MDLSNRKNMRSRYDFEYQRPMTLDNWRQLLARIETEPFYCGEDQYYSVEKVHGEVLIYTEPRGDVIEVTVYAFVDLGNKLKS